MSYRNELRKAAIFILKSTCREPEIVIKKIVGKDVNIEAFPWIELKGLRSTRFSKKVLREAVELLFAAKEIDMLDNEIDRFDVKIKCTPIGRSAFLEHKYQDDINNYRNEKWAKALNWRIGLAGLILALASFTYAIIKDSEVRDLRNQLQKNQRLVQPPGGNPDSIRPGPQKHQASR